MLQIVNQLLNVDPSKRPSLRAILSHSAVIARDVNRRIAEGSFTPQCLSKRNLSWSLLQITRGEEFAAAATDRIAQRSPRLHRSRSSRSSTRTLQACRRACPPTA